MGQHCQQTTALCQIWRNLALELLCEALMGVTSFTLAVAVACRSGDNLVSAAAQRRWMIDTSTSAKPLEQKRLESILSGGLSGRWECFRRNWCSLV